MLSRRDLNRALLARQLLLNLSPMGALAAIEHLVGLSGQTPNTPYLGLWTRLEQFRVADLSDLITARQVVRGAVTRSAVQLVSARDYVGAAARSGACSRGG